MGMLGANGRPRGGGGVVRVDSGEGMGFWLRFMRRASIFKGDEVVRALMQRASVSWVSHAPLVLTVFLHEGSF